MAVSTVSGKYRKKPVVIEAVQWTGDNRDEVLRFHSGIAWSGTYGIEIRTLEGIMRADEGDYIICGVKNEVYPCKPDIFAATYEPVRMQDIAREAGIELPGAPAYSVR
jgi:hypothetical protein